jgi:hypothetical protein
LFIFTNLLCKALDKSLLRKYYKDGTSVVIHFWVPIEKKREKIQKDKKTYWKKTQKIYKSEKKTQGRPESDQRLVEEVQKYKN